MSKIASPLTLDLTNTRAFKTWLYDLWRSTGGDTSTGADLITLQSDVDALEADVSVLQSDVSVLQSDVSVLQSNQVLTKQTIVDLGSTYVFDKTINVVDADVTINSLMTAQIAPIANGYTRPIEEVIYEKITIQPMPKAGSIDFYIQPQSGHIKGLFAITYTVAL
jgi:hypothetical protein